MELGLIQSILLSLKSNKSYSFLSAPLRAVSLKSNGTVTHIVTWGIIIVTFICKTRKRNVFQRRTKYKIVKN